MPVIRDLNFGVTTWFLKPPFLVRIAGALMSLIAFFYLLITASTYTDVLWKAVIGRSHAIFCGLLTLAVFLVVVSYLFSFFRIFPGYTAIFFYISVLFSVVYLLVMMIFSIGFISTSKSHEYRDRIATFLQNSPNSTAAQWFVKKFNVDPHIPETIQPYVALRTVSVKSTLSAISMVWIVISAVIYFIAMFEYAPDSVENIHYLRAEVEPPP
jgi:hypothetical protein